MSETENNLPSGWLKCKINEISTILSGGTPPSKDETNFQKDGIPWITPVDLSGYKEKYISRGRKSLSVKGLENSSAVLVPKNSVLFSSRAPIGYVAICSNDVTTNQGFKNLVINDGVYTEYVYYYMRYIKPLAKMIATGTTFKEISGRAVGSLDLFLCPYNEQVKIAEKLDSLLSKVDTSLERLKKIPEILKRFKQSVLAAACSGELTRDWRQKSSLSFEWENLIFEDLICELRNGLSQKPNEDVNGHPIIKISSVRPFFVKGEEGRFVHISKNDFVKYKIEVNDLLFTRYNGTLEYVGVCARVRNKNMSDFVYPDKIIRVRLDKTKVNAGYIEIIMNSPSIRLIIENIAKTSAGQTGISGKDIKSLPVLLPTMPEQEEIVKRVEVLFSFADHIEQGYQVALQKLQRLTPALLAKAFRGELVPQDPTDEPASELLKRIQANPPAPTKKSARGRKPATPPHIPTPNTAPLPPELEQQRQEAKNATNQDPLF